MATRTPAQNRTLYGLVADLRRRAGLPEDDAVAVMRRVCREVSGQEHSSRLSIGQADEVIRRLGTELDAYRPARAPKPPQVGRKPAPEHTDLSERQVRVLNALFTQAGLVGLPARVKFCQRQLEGRGRPTTQSDYNKLATPLAAMVVRQVRAEDVRLRAEALVGAAGLDAWQSQIFLPDLVRQFAEASTPNQLAAVVTPHRLAKLIEAEDAVEAHRQPRAAHEAVRHA